MYLKLLERKRKKLADGDKTVIKINLKRPILRQETGWEQAVDSWDLSILADPLSSIPH